MALQATTAESEVVPKAHVRKVVATESGSDPEIRFHISSSSEHPVSVHLIETLPDDGGLRMEDVDATYEWQGLDSTRFKFEAVVPPNASRRVTYTVEESSTAAETLASISTRLVVKATPDADAPGVADGTLPEPIDDPVTQPIWQVSVRNQKVCVTPGSWPDENVAPATTVLSTNGCGTSTSQQRAEHDTGDSAPQADVDVLDPASSPPGFDQKSVGVLVGIPAYNEASTIGDVVSGARSHADQVLVVDDGSTDTTEVKAVQAGATVLRHERNRGYGAALQSIFEQARQYDPDHLVVLDADGQHAIDDIPELVDKQREESADLIIGSRFAAGGGTNAPYYRRIGIWFINFLVNLSVGTLHPSTYINDTQCGFRVYSQQFINSLATATDLGDGMEASTDIIYHAHRHGYPVEEKSTHVEYNVENPNTEAAIFHGLRLVFHAVWHLNRTLLAHLRKLRSVPVPKSWR